MTTDKDYREGLGLFTTITMENTVFFVFYVKVVRRRTRSQRQLE